MKVVPYIYWEKPGEKEKLKEIINNTNLTEMEVKRAIAKEFNMSLVDAINVLTTYRENFKN